tara:strand:+ start:1754 stop:2326 length:573 start_codon:yes stop_codon:yes gene_type:complete
MTIDEHNKLCAALPVDVNWGDPITPEIVATILESRASNAGGAVAYIPDDALARLTPPLLVLDGVRLYRYNGVGTTALYLHPAPASKEPVADERAAFEAKFPMPADCVRCGDGYAATDYNAWKAHEYVKMWKGWQARAALATAQTPEGWKMVPEQPTLGMLRNFDAQNMRGTAMWIWVEMLAAAPAKPEGV